MECKIIDGYLLQALDRGEVDMIAHVCNCKGVMGSGIALAIKEKYPEAFSVYQQDARMKNLNLGGGSFTDKVVNMYAQDSYGRDCRHLNYEALYQCLCWFKLSVEHSSFTRVGFDDRPKTVGFPYKMGADRAGGDWNVVLAMINSVFSESDIAVRIYKKGKYNE